MIILVDFENTHVNGMNGYTYLNETDTVVVYYSDENSAVTRGMVEDLKSRDVNVRMVKLLKQHANALDMYIASTTGMFLDTGEKICIVSKDKGYAAVRDFWHSLRGAEILLGETIEECFLHSVSNDDPRIRRVKERSQKALLTNAFETMNRIPTRPTLSRANARRRRNEELDTTKNLEPVTILPNPLLKQVPALPTTAELPTEPAESHAAVTESIQIEDALPVSVDNVGASAGESGAGSLNRGGYTNLRPETADRRNNSRRPGRDNRGSRNRSERRNQSEAVFYGEERLPENNEESKAAGKLQEQKAAQQAEEKAASVKEKAASAEKQEKLAEEAEKKTTILNEKENSGRVLPRINKNQIRFVYDPATGTMKKLEAGSETEAAAEEKAEETQQAAAPEAAENEAAAETETVTEAEETEAVAETEVDEEASAEETEPVSLEALGIVPMEAFEKYAPGCNTPHQYYIKLVKRFGKPVGKAVFGVTKKEMQAELKRRKQLTEETTESAETAEAAENTEVATETWSKTEQIMKLAGEMYTAMAESVERIRNARVSKAAEAEVSAEESIEEEHPVVEALPVHPEEPVSVMTADEAQTADEVQAADAEAEKAAEVSAVKQESGEVSEEEALAAAQYGHYVQLSMDFTENGDINALRADAPADSEERTAAQEETKDAAETVKEAAAEAEKAAEATGEANAEKEAAVKKPVRKRRSRKSKTEEAEAAEQPTASAEADSAESEKAKKPARKRTGRKKKAEGAEGEAAAAAKTEKAASEAENAEAKPVKKRGGRRKKAETAEAAVQVEA